MHRDLTFFQDITDTFQNGETNGPINSHSNLSYSFLCGSSLYVLNTVPKRHLIQYELNLNRRVWEKPKQLVGHNEKLYIHTCLFVCLFVFLKCLVHFKCLTGFVNQC